MRKKTSKQANKPVSIKRLPNEAAISTTVTQVISVVDQAIARSQLGLAEYHLEQLLEAAPKSQDAKLRLLKIGASIGLQSPQIITQLESQRPVSIEVVTALARYYLLTGRTGKAEEQLELALKLRPKSAEIWKLRGETFEATGQHENALAAYDRAISLDGMATEAMYRRSVLARGEATPRQRAQVQRAVEQVAPGNVKQYAMAHLAMGWLCRQDPEEEFRWLHKAKRQMAQGMPFNIQNEQKMFDKIFSFSTDAPAREALAARADVPTAPVFVAGLPRSGTTLVEHILASHPDFSATGESHSMLNACSRVALRRSEKGDAIWMWAKGDMDTVLGQMTQAYHKQTDLLGGEGSRLIDKSLEMSSYLGVAKLLFPRARFIHIERHPLDIILSNYQHYIVTGYKAAVTLEQLAENYLHVNRCMDQWKATYPADILTVSYENLVTNFEFELRRMLKFVGSEWNDTCLNFHGQEASVLTPSAMQVRKPINHSGLNRWQQYEEQLQPAARVLGL